MSRLIAIGVLFFILRVVSAEIPPPGSIDSEFAPELDGVVYAIAVRSDGKIVVGGNFKNVNGASRPGLVQLNPDGSLDTAFSPGGGVSGGPDNNPRVNRIIIDNEGRLLIGGPFFGYDGKPCNGLARLLPDGALDTTFTPPAGVGITNFLHTGYYLYNASTRNSQGLIALLADGKILAPGPRGIARLMSDGSLDTSFEPLIERLTPVTDGSVTSIVWPADIMKAFVQKDGQYLLFGRISFVNDVATRNRAYDTTFVRLDQAGVLDPNFSIKFDIRGAASAAAKDQRDRVLMPEYTLNHTVVLHRVDGDASVDSDFQPPAFSAFLDLSLDQVLVEPGGKILVGGRISHVNGIPRRTLARLNADGTLDQSFDIGAGPAYMTQGEPPDQFIRALALQEDGKILMGGEFTEFNEQPRRLVRLHGGELSSAPRINEQPENLVVMAGQQAVFSVLVSAKPSPRFQWEYNGNPLPGATNDTLLLPNVDLEQAGEYSVVVSNELGVVKSEKALLTVVPQSLPVIVKQPVNLQVQEGGMAQFTVTATNLLPMTYQWYRDGAPLPGATANTLSLTNVTTADAGSYHVTVSTLVGTTESSRALLGVTPLPKPPGSIDPTYAPTLGFNGNHWVKILAMEQQPDGKILIGGGLTSVNGMPRFGVARLNLDGSIDSSFDANRLLEQPIRQSTTKFGYVIRRLAVAAEGKILMAATTRGSFYDCICQQPDMWLHRLNSDGSLDSTFVTLTNTSPMLTSFPSTSPPKDFFSMVPLADGKTLVAGSIVSVNGKSVPGIYRALADGTVDATFVPQLPTGEVEFIGVQMDGRIIVTTHIAEAGSSATTVQTFRLESDGRLDASFAAEETLAAANLKGASPRGIQKDDKILLAEFSVAAGRVRFIRLNPDGTRDDTFSPDAACPLPGTLMTAPLISLLDDNRGFVMALSYWNSKEGYGGKLFRFAENGTLDPTFATNQVILAESPQWVSQINALIVQKNQNIVIGGSFATVDGAPRNSIARIVGGAPGIALRHPRLDITGSQLTFSFLTESNRTYKVQSVTSLSAAEWMEIANLTGNGATVTVTNSLPQGSAGHFYRVRIE